MKARKCRNCNHGLYVEPTNIIGQVVPYKIHDVVITADFTVLACPGCKEWCVSYADINALDKHLKWELQKKWCGIDEMPQKKGIK